MDDLLVDVSIWGRLVGSLLWDASLGTAVFEYDDGFRQGGLDLAPLSMPRSMGNRPFSCNR